MPRQGFRVIDAGAALQESVPYSLNEPDVYCADVVRLFRIRSERGVHHEVQALQGLNLCVNPGELIAVVGASGSGKSTLMAILSSLDRPTAGTVRVAGRDLLRMTPRDRVEFRRWKIGFVWQNVAENLLPYLSASANVALPMSIARNGSRRSRAKKVADLLELLGVGHCAERRPSEMSGGEQQRVAIAVGLANSPSVLLADEPTGQLDMAASLDVLEALRTVNRDLGVTTLIVTHDRAVSDHVQRTVQIRDGRTSSEVLRSVQLDANGSEIGRSDEFAVLDRFGRLQLPADVVEALSLRERVRLNVATTHLEVWPKGEAGVLNETPKHGRRIEY